MLCFIFVKKLQNKVGFISIQKYSYLAKLLSYVQKLTRMPIFQFGHTFLTIYLILSLTYEGRCRSNSQPFWANWSPSYVGLKSFMGTQVTTCYGAREGTHNMW